MLRVWEDLSGKYRMNYEDDDSHEYIEVHCDNNEYSYSLLD